jgi:hypothetical protein
VAMPFGVLTNGKWTIIESRKTMAIQKLTWTDHNNGSFWTSGDYLIEWGGSGLRVMVYHGRTFLGHKNCSRAYGRPAMIRRAMELAQAHANAKTEGEAR